MEVTPKQQHEQGGAIAKTLAALTTHTRATILRSLASRALIDRRHVACAIATTDAQVVQIDNPARLGIVHAVLRFVLAAFNGTLADGDIVLTNDPFSGGTHLQDVTLVTPFFFTGQVIGYGIVQVPLADIGGMALGGYYPRALEIWAEGVRVTPVKFYRGGHLQRDALTMLLLNSRLPHLIEKDLEIMVGALGQCRTEVSALASRQTLAGYGQALQRILATTEARVREAIQTFTPGQWRGVSEPIHSCLEDQEFRIVVHLSVADGALSLDFSGSSGSAKGFINTTVATTTAAALMPFYNLWQSLPANDGLLRPFSFVIPPDSLLHAKLPMSVGWSSYQPSMAVAQAVNAALQQAQTARVPLDQVEEMFSPPALPFMVSGCGRRGCPFPSLSRT